MSLKIFTDKDNQDNKIIEARRHAALTLAVHCFADKTGTGTERFKAIANTTNIFYDYLETGEWPII